MLQKLRDKTSGWFATAVLGVLVVPFAFFGMEQYLFQNNETFVAKIEALFQRRGHLRYGDERREPVTALEHALQCAQLAEWAHAEHSLVAAALQSLADGRRLDTPHLAVRYQAPRESTFWQA